MSGVAPACWVHDYLYDLRRHVGIPLDRKAEDQLLLDLLRSICGTKSWFVRPYCNAEAGAFYLGVRLKGS